MYKHIQNIYFYKKTISTVFFITVADKLQKLNETLQIVNVMDLYKVYLKNGKNVNINFILNTNTYNQPHGRRP